jgi:tetratricopeptide (TPR) repeat protein
VLVKAVFITALLIATAAAYLPVVNFGYVSYDDTTYVADNSHVSSGLTAEEVGWSLTAMRGGTWQPLVWMSFMADVSLCGKKPGCFHLTNLILHLANAALLFVVVMLLSGESLKSGVVAALFALHPIHVEAVAWISARKDVLSGLLFLLALVAYCRYVRKPGLARYAASLAPYCLGLMAKPMLVTLPCLLLLLDYWPLGRFHGFGRGSAGGRLPAKPAVGVIVEKLPFVFLAGVSAVITYAAQHKVGAVGTLSGFPLGLRVSNAAISYLKYLYHFVWPLRLATAYQMPTAIPAWQTVSACACLALVTALVFARTRRAPFLLTGWFWYVIALLPVIQLIPIGTHAMADRFAYLPFIGVYLALAWTVTGSAKHGRRMAGAAAVAVMVAGSALVTHRQVGYWADTRTLFERALAVEPLNYSAHIGLGSALKKEGDRAGAMEHYQAALRANPDGDLAYNGIGTLLLSRQQASEAVGYFEQSLRLNPRSVEALVNSGAALEESGADPEEVLRRYRRALVIDPEYSGAHYNIARTLAARGEFDEARKHYETAIALKPDYADAYYNLGLLYEGTGQPRQAADQYRQALGADPGYAMAHNNLGVLLAREGDTEAAALHFAAALKLAPDNRVARENLKRAREESARTGRATPAGPP